MIISYDRGFVFVKSRKTAGTSVEIALSEVCGPQDIIAAIAAEDEANRRSLGFRTAQNTVLPARAITLRDAARWVKRRHRPEYCNHMPARQIRRAVGKQSWEQLFAFTIERNPWDRAVSLYYWRMQGNPDSLAFSEFIRRVEPDRLSNFDVYSRRGEVCVDRILRYEHLDDELSAIWRELRLPGDPHLVNAKGGQRPTSARDYRRMYCEQDVQYVAERCAREIALLGYTFP